MAIRNVDRLTAGTDSAPGARINLLRCLNSSPSVISDSPSPKTFAMAAETAWMEHRMSASKLDHDSPWPSTNYSNDCVWNERKKIEINK